MPLKLRLRKLDADHRGQPLAHVVTGEVLLHVFEQPAGLSSRVYGAREGAAEAAEVRAAIDGVDVVGEAEDRLGVAIVVLQGDFNGEHAAVGQSTFALKGDRLLMQYALAAVEVLNELGDTAAVMELVNLERVLTFVIQGNLQALVEKCQFPQPLGESVVVEHARVHDGGIGTESNLCARFSAGLASARQGSLGNSLGVLLLPSATVAPNFDRKVLREGIDATHAHTVKTTGDFVAVGIEFTAGVQLGKHHLRRGNAFIGMDVHRDAAPIVLHGD